MMRFVLLVLAVGVLVAAIEYRAQHKGVIVMKTKKTEVRHA